MFTSATQISFKNREEVIADLLKTLKSCVQNEYLLTQNNFFHSTSIKFYENTADITITFSKSFYFFYLLIGLICIMLPFENALIGSSAFALFLIFSAVMYFSLDYKLKTILDGFY